MFILIVKLLIGATFIAYVIPLLYIFFYSIAQTNLVIFYLRNKKDKTSRASFPLKSNTVFPYVTVQLPVFNELYVVERLIDSIANLDYPKDRFEIQVLDDSTDETTELISDKVINLKSQGFQASHIKRKIRRGYKAGALSHGLTIAKGQFIAIFDADFLPSPDFLMQTIPHFQDSCIGAVQTRWEHINENYSFLTQLQAFGLDAHFSIEQKRRNNGGYLINFNGTAGVFRKQCILDAGNWNQDTLTEDLDLSYRAQLKGWKFKYLDTVGTPSELPVSMSALKTQQFRWTKGAAECSRKHLISVFRSNNLSLLSKIHSMFHLTNSIVFPCILLSSILSVPLFVIKQIYPAYSSLFFYASFSLISLFLLGIFYWVSASHRRDRIPFILFLRRFLMFLSFSMGFSLHNSVAIIDGHLGKKLPFIRTPKFNINTSKDRWRGKRYLINGITTLTFLECLMAIYFLMAVFLAIVWGDFGLLPFHLMLAGGFGLVAGYSFLHSTDTSDKCLNQK
jgi:cellulose synthase/poly-beta-1,6-N-acetylglucosamine synthase-like glycosyltransferase